MALGEVTLRMLESLVALSNDNQAKTVEIKDFEKLNLFGLIRMLETCIINIERIHLLWETVSAHIDCLASSKFYQLRSLALDSLTCLIINVFLAHKGFKCEIKLHKWQQTILGSLSNIISGEYNDCIKGVSTKLPNVIEVYFFVL